MTENKRFILKENGIIDDTQLNILLDGGEDKEDMVDLLNELSDENKQLKQQVSEQGTQIDFLKDENKHMRKVLEENKKLKQNLKQIQDSLWTTEHIRKLEKENEQLKQYIYDNLDENICKVCSYRYLEEHSQMQGYYVSKCKKGYDNCSKGTVIHCKDFKFKELQE